MPDTNSYSEVADADTYFDNRLYATVWTSASDDDKQRALNDGTALINKLNYKGVKTDKTQQNQFPRTGIIMDFQKLDPAVVPDDILNAQFEIAFALLKGYDPDSDIRSSIVTSRRYSSVGIAYDSKQMPEFIKFGIPSLRGWQYLYPYLDLEHTGAVNIHRVD